MIARRLAMGCTGAAMALAAALVQSGPAMADSCANAQYRTGASAALPDCRAYEQVSPREKNGQPVWAGMPTTAAAGSNLYTLAGWASPDGKRVLFNTAVGPSAPEPTRGFGGYPQVAERTAGGWDGKRGVVPGGARPENRFNSAGIQLFFQLPNADRSGALFSSSALLTPEQPVGTGRVGGVYSARAGETALWLTNPQWSGAVPAPGSPELVGVSEFAPVGQSDDGSTFYFMTQQVLTPEDVASGRQWKASWALYRWEDGVMQNAGVLPGGQIDAAGSMSPGLALFQPGSTWKDIGQANRNNFTATLGSTNVVSRDGQRALFLGLGGGDLIPARVPQLYLFREGEETLLLSKREDADDPVENSRGVAAIGMYSSTYSGGGATHNDNQLATLNAFADRDLGIVVFSTQDQLTDDAPAATNVIKTYRYIVSTGDLEYLSDLDRPWTSGTPERNAGNVVRMSDDGSRILFWTPSGELKLWRDGASTLTLMTGLETSGNVSTLGARFSDDGKTVVFMSTRPSAGTIPGDPDHPAGATPLQTQVYRFEEGVDNAPRCVSCPPVAAAVRGPANFSLTLTHQGGFGQRGAYAATAAETRAASADGRRVFFTTTSTLDSRDQNGVADVYEWSADRDGDGLALLSSGAAGSGGSGLLDVDASGGNVFFVTGDVLTASDTDDLSDLYVARIGGGLPDPAPFDRESSCAVEDCQDSSASGPVVPQVGSVSFGGDGNVRSSTERKGTSVRVSRLKAVTGSVGRLRVRVPAAGRIVVAGTSVRRVARSTSKAGVYPVRIALKPRARKALRDRKKLSIAVRVSYRGADGSAAKRVSVTFKQPKAKNGRAKRGNR